MILEHQTLDLFDQPLFSWLELDTPMSGSLPIPTDACFTYFVKGDDQALSAQPRISARSEHVVVSLCSMSMGQLLTQQKGRIQSMIVHFNPVLLKEAFRERQPPYWKELEKPVTQFVAQMAASNLIQHYIKGIQQLFTNPLAVTDEILILKLKEIILLLLQTENHPQVLQIMRSLFSKRSFTFKETIEAYLYTPASIKDLAQLTNTSLSTFKREFARLYQTTPGQYILNRRLQKVAYLLQVSDEPISAIGYDCGFSTPAHLTKVFKVKYQKTPSQYRLDLADK